MPGNLHVHFIQQEESVGPGEYLNWARSKNARITYTRCWLYERLPGEDEELPDILIVLGGPQSPASTKEEYPYYDAPAQISFIQKCAEAGKAVVGSCLGAQLVGEAMGAEYEHSPEREIGSVMLRLTNEGRSDPVLSGLPDEFPASQWHNDMPGLGKRGTVLAESEGCPRQIVRYGYLIYGLQCHMEFTHDLIVSVMEAEGTGDFLDKSRKYRFVQSTEEILSFDTAEMNRQLSGIMDRLAEAYRGNEHYTEKE